MELEKCSKELWEEKMLQKESGLGKSAYTITMATRVVVHWWLPIGLLLQPIASQGKFIFLPSNQNATSIQNLFLCMRYFKVNLTLPGV